MSVRHFERQTARFKLVEAKWNARRARSDAVTATVKAVVSIAVLAVVLWIILQGDLLVAPVIELLRVLL